MALATIQIGLRWQDRERTSTVPLPPEQSTLLDLLPAARALAHDATGMALDQVRSEGKEISCCAGCGACCRQLVAISMIEALALADLVDSMPAERQGVIRLRFRDAATRLEEAGLLDPSDARGERSLVAKDSGARAATLQNLSRRYFELGIPCPFLEEESCSIHPDRPIVCREHHVTTPAENCAKLFQVNVERVEPALRVGEALARTADRAGGHGRHMVPLVLALEFAEARGESLREKHDGQELFQAMMEELGR
jgi:Fe-S-cluster containining protein